MASSPSMFLGRGFSSASPLATNTSSSATTAPAGTATDGEAVPIAKRVRIEMGT
jgi:hypothetical protein